MQDLKENQTSWLKQHELTVEQFNKLIQDKLARAASTQLAVKQREALLEGR